MLFLWSGGCTHEQAQNLLRVVDQAGSLYLILDWVWVCHVRTRAAAAADLCLSMNSANPPQWQVQGPHTTEAELPLARVENLVVVVVCSCY